MCCLSNFRGLLALVIVSHIPDILLGIFVKDTL